VAFFGDSAASVTTRKGHKRQKEGNTPEEERDGGRGWRGVGFFEGLKILVFAVTLIK